MFAATRDSQDVWMGDEGQGGSIVSSVSGQSRSDFDAFAAETVPGKQPSGVSSTANGQKGSLKTPGVMRAGEGLPMKNGQTPLAPEKAFSIQIGWRLFRLSGVSIMSDGQYGLYKRNLDANIPRAPSYFSAYFEDQTRMEDAGNGAMKTLFIDRDPETFADICRHLQGYAIIPRNNQHFVRLYADANFYNLPRLISQLFDSDIFASIGGQQFQIPRDTFSGPGNSSNFFSLGFAGFMSTRDDVFPGLEIRGLVRPPPIHPQSVPNRSPRTFSDLIHLARGYPLTIVSPDHRAELLSDCKYYGFKGLMHKLFAHEITYNAERGTSEILMRLEDLHKSGISFFNNASPSDQSPLGGWVYYSRPFVDETSYEAIIEIGAQETKIDFRSMRADFYGDTKARISSLFQVVADKMNLPSNLPLGLMMSSGGASAAPASPANTPLSEDRVKIRIGPDAHILLDGQEHIMEPHLLDAQQEAFETATPTSATNPTWPSTRSSSLRTPQAQQSPPPSKKRKRGGSLDDFGEWIIRKGQWRMRVQPRTEQRRGSEGGMESILVAVKLDAVSGQRGRNMGRNFVT